MSKQSVKNTQNSKDCCKASQKASGNQIETLRKAAAVFNVLIEHWMMIDS